MRRILTSSLEPGMIVGRTIYDSDGRPLMNQGVCLRGISIQQLYKRGIASVYICDDVTDEELEDVVQDKTRLQAVQVVKQCLQQAHSGGTPNFDAARQMVQRILEDVSRRKDVLVNLVDIRAVDDYTFGHCVNVCVLSLLAGIRMDFSTETLYILGSGALLHDIGKIGVPSAILNKPTKLLPEEYLEVQKHCEFGFGVLRKQSTIHTVAAHIAFQHHERWDGEGYPRRLRNDAILDLARLVSVADAYDAMTADRVYQPGIPPSAALNILENEKEKQLDPQMVHAFAANIAPYPAGSVVELSNGMVGLVIGPNTTHASRPDIKVLLGPDRRPVSRDQQIRLVDQMEIHIRRVLP